MKKIIIFTLIVFLTILSKAQTVEEPVVVLSTGISFQNIKSKSFSQFQENYINYYGNNIKKTGYTPGIGAYFQINVAPYLNIEYSGHNSKKEILFINDDRMGFKFISNQFRLTFGMALSSIEDDQIMIRPQLGLGFGRNHLEVDVKTNNLNARDLELAGRYSDGNIMINPGVEVFLKPSSSSPLGLKFYLRQNLTLLSFTMIQKDKFTLEDRIPIDYAAWRNTRKGDYLGDAVKGNFRFLELGVGLSLIFADL
jgi:hypothetical protein